MRTGNVTLPKYNSRHDKHIYFFLKHIYSQEYVSVEKHFPILFGIHLTLLPCPGAVGEGSRWPQRNGTEPHTDKRSAIYQNLTEGVKENTG